MFGIGVPELLIVGFLVLIIFGAGKIPEIMGKMGTGIRDFRGAITEDHPDRPGKEGPINEEKD